MARSNAVKKKLDKAVVNLCDGFNIKYDWYVWDIVQLAMDYQRELSKESLAAVKKAMRKAGQL